MANKDYALTTKERVKARLSITNTDVDDIIVGIIYAVTDMLEKHLGRRFKETTYTNKIFSGLNYGKPVDFLLLPNAPVTALSAFEYNSGTITNPTWVAVNADSYYLDELLNGIQMTGGFVPQGHKNLRVTYTGGYKIAFDSFIDDTAHTLPADISDLAERLCTKIYNKRETEGQSTSNFGESNITWESLITPAEMALVAPYKRNHALGL